MHCHGVPAHEALQTVLPEAADHGVSCTCISSPCASGRCKSDSPCYHKHVSAPPSLPPPSTPPVTEIIGRSCCTSVQTNCRGQPQQLLLKHCFHSWVRHAYNMYYISNSTPPATCHIPSLSVGAAHSCLSCVESKHQYSLHSAHKQCCWVCYRLISNCMAAAS